MEGKNIFNSSIWLLVILFLFSCGDLYNPKERNKILFADPLDSVLDSISNLNTILIKSKRKYYIYAVAEDNNLYVSEKEAVKVGLLSNKSLVKNKSLEFIDVSERQHFISLVTFLNKNYLCRCDIEGGIPIYIYKHNIYMADRQKDLFRFIVLTSSYNNIDLNRYKILDRYRNLYLLAYKDARIYSSD